MPIVLIKKIFVEVQKNEEYAIDFRAFLQLFNLVDNVYIYGLKNPGFLDKDEFLALIDKDIINRYISKYIDSSPMDTDLGAKSLEEISSLKKDVVYDKEKSFFNARFKSLSNKRLFDLKGFRLKK